jgi:hypothetical protein
MVAAVEAAATIACEIAVRHLENIAQIGGSADFVVARPSSRL